MGRPTYQMGHHLDGYGNDVLDVGAHQFLHGAGQVVVLRLPNDAQQVQYHSLYMRLHIGFGCKWNQTVTVESRYLELGYLEFCETLSVWLNQTYILIAFSNHNFALETF